MRSKSFSERQGIKKPRLELQVDGIDEKLRNSLWNLTLNNFLRTFSTSTGDSFSPSESASSQMAKAIWEHFLDRTTDTLRSKQYSRFTEASVDHFILELRTWVFQAEWFEIYELLEFYINGFGLGDSFIDDLNSRLTKYHSGFRFMKSLFVPITSKQELAEVEEAIETTESLDSIHEHLNAALTLFSDRENPDYRNSIKESITAVESTCKFIMGNPKTTLGSTLNQLEKTEGLHKALKTSFSALYGWTSDAGGIRHSLTADDIEVGFEEAKFMIVSCFAFINYLLLKMKPSR